MDAGPDTNLADVFLARWSERQAGEMVVARSQLAERLAQVTRSAEERWVPVRVPVDSFVRYLADRMPKADGVDPLSVLDTLRTDQLYLACACVAGVAGALAAFDREFFPTVTLALRGMDKTGALTDEATQLLRQRLFVSAQGRPPKIADYLGQGDLRRWVRAAAVRLGIDLLRSSKREELGREDEKVLAALPDSASDPELAHLKKLYGNELKQAFGEVLRGLPSKERTILRYHYVDGLNIEQIGTIFQVHKATAFRWLERARGKIVPQTRKRLQNQLGVKAQELDSIMRLIHSRLDLSIQRFLETQSGGDDPGAA